MAQVSIGCRYWAMAKQRAEAVNAWELVTAANERWSECADLPGAQTIWAQATAELAKLPGWIMFRPR